MLACQTTNKSRKCCTVLMSFTPYKFMKVRHEQRLGCPKLSTQFTLNTHPKVFNVLGVDGVIIRIHKMLMMDDDIMSVNSMVDVFDLSISRPTIGNNMGSRQNILHNCLFQSHCSTIQHLH